MELTASSPDITKMKKTENPQVVSRRITIWKLLGCSDSYDEIEI